MQGARGLSTGRFVEFLILHAAILMRNCLWRQLLSVALAHHLRCM